MFFFLLVGGGAWLNARVFSLRLVTGRAVIEGFEREKETKQNQKSDDL
jgi:hypothetical protein